jgi:hypothetical protein
MNVLLLTTAKARSWLQRLMSEGDDETIKPEIDTELNKLPSEDRAPDAIGCSRDACSDEDAVRFPWEEPSMPSSDDSKQQTTPAHKPETNLIDERTLVLAQQHLKELEFLAGMTFANGGIRAPACLCCQ